MHPRSTSPYLGTAMARPARARVVKDIVTPRTASELHELWGRTLDQKFTTVSGTGGTRSEE